MNHYSLSQVFSCVFLTADGKFLSVKHLFPDETLSEVPSHRYRAQSYECGVLAASSTDAFRLLFSDYCQACISLGFQMIQMPMSIIGGSIRQVFLQRSAVAKHNATLPELVNEICSVLIMLSVMPFLLLGVVGGDLFGLVFGSEWYEA